MNLIDRVGWLLVIFVLGAIAGSVERGRYYQIEINALHAQIEKQNCEEMTWPKLKRSVK